jgi:hypothetical protein
MFDCTLCLPGSSFGAHLRRVQLPDSGKMVFVRYRTDLFQ